MLGQNEFPGTFCSNGVSSNANSMRLSPIACVSYSMYRYICDPTVARQVEHTSKDEGPESKPIESMVLICMSFGSALLGIRVAVTGTENLL